MNFTRQIHNPLNANRQGWHILTVAEAGFSMLDLYARQHKGADGEAIQRFVDRVNQLNEPGTFHPRAPISAIPSRFFRCAYDSGVLDDFKRHLHSFLAMNAAIIHAHRLVLDFHVSAAPVPTQYLEAAEKVFRNLGPENSLQEVVIFT